MLKMLSDIHPDQRSGKGANHCFIGYPTTPSTHESISLGKYFKELMQSKTLYVQSFRTS